MKIAQQLLEAVLQFMNASAMTQVLTLIFLALIIQVLKTLITVRIPLYSITDWHRSPISDSHPFDQPGT